MAKRSRCPARNQRVAVSILGGGIYFHFGLLACFLPYRSAEPLQEIKHDHSPVVKLFSTLDMINHKRPCIFIAAV